LRWHEGDLWFPCRATPVRNGGQLVEVFSLFFILLMAFLALPFLRPHGSDPLSFPLCSDAGFSDSLARADPILFLSLQFLPIDPKLTKKRAFFFLSTHSSVRDSLSLITFCGPWTSYFGPMDALHSLENFSSFSFFLHQSLSLFAKRACRQLRSGGIRRRMILLVVALALFPPFFMPSVFVLREMWYQPPSFRYRHLLLSFGSFPQHCNRPDKLPLAEGKLRPISFPLIGNSLKIFDVPPMNDFFIKRSALLGIIFLLLVVGSIFLPFCFPPSQIRQAQNDFCVRCLGNGNLSFSPPFTSFQRIKYLFPFSQSSAFSHYFCLGATRACTHLA